MLNEQILGRWHQLKNSMHNFSQLMQDKFHKMRDAEDPSPSDIHIDNYHYESHRTDDLPLTMSRDTEPGVKYDYTENSEFSRGAEKTAAFGIDSFGEEDTFDPDEMDDRKSYRQRSQGPDFGEHSQTP